MPKVKISEYSATANSNTDVASINIDEGCAPSGINNAIRAVMGHLKDFQQGTNGDPFNGPVNGTLGATTASTAVVTTLNSTDATDASSTTAAAMKTAGGLGVAKKMFVGLDANIYGLTVGRGAGAVSTNTAVGASALAGSNSGTGQNTAIGSNALVTNTTGANNTSVGYVSLFSNTTGTRNTATGVGALYSNTTGASNSAFSINALNGNTTGSFNVAVGDGALQTNTTASNNTAVGYQAGYANTTGATNCFFGNQAGYTANSSSNTFIGPYAGYYVSSGAKNTILGGYNGNQGGLDIRTASNYIVLSDGDGNPRLFLSSAGFPYCLGAYTNNGPASANMFVDSTGQIYRATSSLKYKRDVENATHGLSDVMGLRSVTYKSKREDCGNTVYGGFIAEEVHALGLTEFVDYNDEGEPDAIHYGSMVSLLTKAIQELKAEVDSLKSQLNGASA